PRFVHATVTELYRYDLANSTIAKVDLGWENGLSGSTLEVTDDGLVTLLAGGARNKPIRIRRTVEGWQREWLTGAHASNLFDLRVGKDGTTLLYDHSCANKPGQWYRASLNGATVEAPTQLTDLNGSTKKKTVARTEVVRWKGALNEDVEGILYYP